MAERTAYDGVIVGSGPNGLAAAITLARAGWRVIVFEAKETIGGGMRSAELTLPGFVHDICSAIHPLGLGSPFNRTLPLADYGVEWIHPDIPLAHPLDHGAAALHRSFNATADSLGRDGNAWRRLFEPLAADWDKLGPALLSPLPLPRHPLALTRFGLFAVWPAKLLVQTLFREPEARALFAGMAAHAILPLDQVLTASFGLVLGIVAHALGWPMARGGSQRIADAMAGYLRDLGGEIVTGHEVRTLADVPPARATLFDLAPQGVLRLAGDQLPPGYRRQLERYRYGPGVFKVDYALAGPVPWRAEACRHAGTIHVGGTVEEIMAGEHTISRGQPAERPYVLVAQQSLFDPSRAPAGKHTLWAYCHVPNGSSFDMTSRLEAQIERFAPGFRDLILARHVRNAVQLQEYNPNYVGGDINTGVQDWRQLWTRPTLKLNPYEMPAPGLYLCSSATPPGGGVHGMCGYYAAQSVLRRHGRMDT